MRAWIKNLNRTLLESASVIGDTVYIGTTTFKVRYVGVTCLQVSELKLTNNKYHTMDIKLYDDEYDLLKYTLDYLRENHIQDFISKYENA